MTYHRGWARSSRREFKVTGNPYEHCFKYLDRANTSRYDVVGNSLTEKTKKEGVIAAKGT